MNTITFLLHAFGFENWQDLRISLFGFALNKQVLISSGVIGFFSMLLDKIPLVFGVEYAFFLAYVGLVILEWSTGVWASLKRGEKHESRKLGRMLLKVFIYSLLVALLNQMTKIEIPQTVSFLELVNPFLWLYWAILMVIIWQLWISVFENLDSLGFRFAKVAVKLLNQKFERNLKLKE